MRKKWIYVKDDTFYAIERLIPYGIHSKVLGMVIEDFMNKIKDNPAKGIADVVSRVCDGEYGGE